MTRFGPQGHCLRRLALARCHRASSTAALLLWVAALTASPAGAQNAFVQSNLVSNLPGMAAVTDTNLVNPWGLSFSGTSPFWVADNGSGLSTLYNGAGGILSLVVTIPPPAGQTGPAAPSGTIANSVAGFLGSGTNTAHFLFSTEDGTISAWNSGAAAVLKVDYSMSNAVFKGLAAGASGGSNYIYAPDFHNGQVDVFDTNYLQVTLAAGAFTDTNLPAGYAPFGIENIGGQLYVTYALQDAAKHDDVGGPGHGYVDIFDTSGNLVRSFTSQGALNSPWGVAKAPLGLGPFSGDILVGNFGDGRINAYDPISGEWLAALADTTGAPFAVPGLWAIAFGNGHSGGSAGTLYFTAGINAEADGLFGSLAPLYPSPTNGVSFLQSNLVSNLPGLAAVTDTNLVNPWGLSFSATSPFWVADNGSGLSTLYNSTGGIQGLVVTIPPPAGQTFTASPSGTIANSVAGFLATGTNTAHFLFSTEDGTISAWNSGAAAVLKVDYSMSNAVFKGLAAGASRGSNYIYAPDFHNGQVDVFDTNYLQVTLAAGAFTDTNLPAGYAPFGIENIGGQLYVTYALQDAAKHDDVAGIGNGYVDVYDTRGYLLQRLISQGVLNSPWGVTLAPAGFGAYGGDLLVGNFGDGRINVFNPATGAWLGALLDAAALPIEVPGLWAITFGNGHSGGDAHTLYFTAGINDEADGLFASVAPLTPSFVSVTSGTQGITFTWTGGGAGPFELLQSTDLSGTNWTVVTTTTNLTVTIPATNPAAFFQLSDQGE